MSSANGMTPEQVLAEGRRWLMLRGRNRMTAADNDILKAIDTKLMSVDQRLRSLKSYLKKEKEPPQALLQWITDALENR